jgi:MYXO-CTERM domain-containing protein
VARASEPDVVQNPYAIPAPSPVVIDVAAGTVNGRHVPLAGEGPRSRVEFGDLDAYIGTHSPADPSFAAELPDGLAQMDDMVVPEEVLAGAIMVGDADLVGEGGVQHEPLVDCAYPDAVPAGIYEGDPRPGLEFPRRGTIFLNFLGGVLYAMGENSAENYSNIARSGHPYPVFAGGETLAIAVAQAVQADFAAWQIRVLYDPRPPKVLPYTMAMVGGSYSDTTSGPAGGVAPIDCEDFGLRNVCYSFTNTEPATSQANVVSQEVAHTYGLEHTYGADRIMSYEGGGDKIFGSNCQETFALPNQGNGCQGINKCWCGDGDFQNDSLTIGVIYAPPGPDITPPTIAITAPEDGAVFQTTDTIVVTFGDVWDDYGGYGWKLVVDNAETGEVLVDQVDYDRALMFELFGMPPGTYHLTAHIMDQADQIAEHTITIIIEGEASGTDDSGGLDGGSGGGMTFTSSGSGDAGSGDSDTGGGSGEDPNGSEDGCGCRTDARGGAALLGLGLVSALATRRRRRR